MIRSWTDEQKQFLRDNYGKLSYAEIAARLDKPVSDIKSQASKLRITATRKWPEKDVQRLRELYPNTRSQEIADLLDRNLSAIHAAANKLGLSKSEEFKNGPFSGRLTKFNADARGSKTRFQKGQTSWNRGKKIGSHPNSAKTQFKKGHMPHNLVPVGTEVVATIGYLKIKIAEPNIWEFSHHRLWREYHGDIPPSHMIAFRDGNRLNVVIDNLELVSRKEWIKRHTLNNYPEPIKGMIHTLAGFKRRLNSHAKKQD